MQTLKQLFNFNSKNKIYILFIIFLLMIGIFVRFYDLGTHFTHYDSVFMATDILKAKSPDFKNYILARAYDQTRPAYNELYMRAIRKMNDIAALKPLFDLAIKLSPVFIVSASSTNPPLQYLFNVPLIHGWQTYRQIMFWGRFPSFLFAVGCFFLLIILNKKLNNQSFYTYTFFSLALLVFSWQHIIYAKQLYTYSIGVFAVYILMVLFLSILQNKKESYLKWFGLANAGLFYATYQIFFIQPAFYISLFLFFYQNKDYENIKILIKNILIYFVLILPGLVYVLINFSSEGTHAYSIGSKGEFLFQLNSQSGFIGKIFYFFSFYLKNFYYVLQTNLTIVPEKTWFYTPWAVFLYVLFFLGLLAVTQTKDKYKKYFGLNTILVIIIWLGLVFIKKLPLTPTRTSLIYLPFQLFLVSEGFIFLLEIILKFTQQKRETVACNIVFFFVLIISVLFLAYFPKVVKERQDPINEIELTNLVKKYQVDTVIGYKYSLNINLMKEIKPLVNYYEEDIAIPSKIQRGWNYRSLLFFSTRQKFCPEIFAEYRNRLNADHLTKNTFRYGLGDYNIVYTKNITSNVEIEFNTKNKNGSNNLFLTVLQRKI